MKTMQCGANMSSIHLFSEAHVPNSLLCRFVCDEGHFFLLRGSKHIDYTVQLVSWVASLKKWLAAQHLSEDTTKGPNVHCISIILAIRQQFRRSVPPCHHVLGQLLLNAVLHSSCKPKITDGQITIGVDKQIGRFHIPVKNIRRMDVFHA
jgi:hypothetical protein